MSKGMEMLINTVLKSVGFDAETFIPEAKKAAQNVALQIKAFDERLTRIENTQVAILGEIAKLNSHNVNGISLIGESEYGHDNFGN